ncbi:MAG: DNA replication and repair protein RecF [Bacteroidales bacterium]|jgi:DNA replication and repair protein RecF|nr:DNA replication and repair protein RecF [Bacteroidales bacterium]
MYLRHLKLANFKSYSEAEFDFCAKINAIIGENGSGKTNLLDAIHYLSFCKSYFLPQDSLSIQFECDFFAIHGEFVRPGLGQDTKVSCTFKSPGRKVMKANQKEYQLLSDHIGQFPLIMISPYDNDIIHDGSEVRRKFFDMIISQFDKEYLRKLISYQKILSQRNALIKQFIEQRQFNWSLIQVFDMQMVAPCQYIFEKRKSYLESIISHFNHCYGFLSNDKENVDIKYESGLLYQTYDEGIIQCETADRKSGHTNFGIHKDDFIFTINNRPIKKIGSQGQQKSFAIALKLAQYDYIYSQKKVKPILLLDDIFDKLDLQRIQRLLELVGKAEIGQVFITDTSVSRVKEILGTHGIENKIFTITR